MPLPPGRDPISVSGINSTTDPELAKAAGELAAWIEYLLHPESNDGPRIYRTRSTDPDEDTDAEMPRRMENLDEQTGQYETVSVIDGYAGDPGVFFRPAQAVSGVNESTINDTYIKLTEGCFTWSDNGRNAPPDEVVTAPPGTTPWYPKLHPVRSDWMQMRLGWVAPEAHSAHEYEGDFIRFQVYTENCFYVVALHMAKYRAIFKKAGEDIAALMNALTEMFARPHPYGGDKVNFDILSIVVTGLVAATAMVISGGVSAGVLLRVVAVEVIGEAVKTASSEGVETRLLLENHYHLRDVAKQYLDGVNKIELDTAEAIRQLYENLRIEVDALRDARRYQVKPTDSGTSMWVPHFRDYL